MSDARALLRAKRQDAKITHPYASYNTTGQLRCIVCGFGVKHASAWEGHIGSKVHRINVAREREATQKAANHRLGENETTGGVESDNFRSESGHPTQKRKAKENYAEVEEDKETETKKRKIYGRPGFPTDFFSDTSRGAILPSFDDSDGEGDTGIFFAPPIKPTGLTAATSRPEIESAIDREFEAFQREVIGTANDNDRREAYDRATVFAEAELRIETNEGFPPEERFDEQMKAGEEQWHLKKEREERELIMDSLVEEERAQEEADIKVVLLKSKLDATKRRRMAKLAAKQLAARP